MALTLPERLRRAILKRRAKPSQQFGQSEDYYTFGGATGCTHVVLQWLIWFWTGKWYSQDEISKMAGYPPPGNNRYRRGLRPSEVERVISKTGIPYEIEFGLTADEVLKHTALGPVGFGHAYSWWPEWQTFYYRGIRADGKPNGYARPLDGAGKTQLSGFTGAHFGMVFGVADGTGGTADVVYAWEPNHGSAARPEKPAYDKLTRTQFARVFNSYRNVLGRSSYSLIPTRGLRTLGPVTARPDDVDEYANEAISDEDVLEFTPEQGEPV